MTRLFRVLVLFSMLILALPALAAPVPADLTLWTAYNQPHTGGTTPLDATWDVDPSGTVVTAPINGKPTFFASPNQADGYRITATFAMPTVDDDFIGIALGFSTDPADVATDYLLVDWRQADQAIDWLE